MENLGGLIDQQVNQASDQAFRAFNAVKTSDKDAARKAAEEFEGLVLAEMLAPMFEPVANDGKFGGGHAEKIWQRHLVDAVAKEISAAGGIGIADDVYQSLLAQQEV